MSQQGWVRSKKEELTPEQVDGLHDMVEDLLAKALDEMKDTASPVDIAVLKDKGNELLSVIKESASDENKTE
jgi:hypothetical protein